MDNFEGIRETEFVVRFVQGNLLKGIDNKTVRK